MSHPTDETDTGYCVYCQRDTTWLVSRLTTQWMRFQCVRCCKISRDVHIAKD